MNRRAVVSFLVLAALVGTSASLDDHKLATLGERLMALQSDINANSTYHTLPRLQAAGAKLAFLDLGDGGGWDIPTAFDGGYGSGYDYNYQPSSPQIDWNSYAPSQFDGGYGSGYDYNYQSPIQPQESWNFDVPSDYNYYNYTPATTWDSDVSAPFDYSAYPYPQEVTWDSDVSAPFDYSSFPDTPPQAFDGGYGSPIDWSAVVPTIPGQGPSSVNSDDPNGYGTLYTPNGQPYPTVDLSRGGSTQTPGGGTSRPSAGNNSVVGQAPDARPSYTGDRYYTTVTENNLTTIQQQMLYYNQGGIGMQQFNTYTPAWYERAFPGWGTAVIPLLPPQYQPNYGYNNNCYGGNGLTGALSVNSNGSFGVALGIGQQNYPCNSGYGNYPLYGNGYYGSQVQPTCSITLADATIAYGAAAQLSWKSYNASSASLNGIGTVALSGTRTLNNQTVSRTFGLTVAGPGGTGACYVTLSVAPQPVQPTCQITASPTSVRRGEATTLAWTSQNATEASFAGLGTVPVQGSRTATPGSDATYTLAVKGANDRVGTCSVSVDVR